MHPTATIGHIQHEKDLTGVDSQSVTYNSDYKEDSHGLEGAIE
jgi:hypothetical protein